MKYNLATNKQLMTIAQYDKDCPPSLLRGLAVEMIKRKMFDNLIVFSARRALINLNYTLTHMLKINHQELIHIGHIEIIRIVDRFKTGMRTFTSYIVMCLIAKFKKMKRDAAAEKRVANIQTKNVDTLDLKIQEKIFQSPVNVEQFVINKIMIEKSFSVLREVEKKAVLLDQEGYTQYEIAKMLGYRDNYGFTLLRRAYKKLRRELVI